MPSQVINTRYEIIETEAPSPLSTFVTSKARDTIEGRVVSLQVLPADKLTGGKAQREALRAACGEAMRLRHPNIARVYDYGESETTGEPYIVSEYLRGMTLQERIRRVAPFKLAVAVDIAVSVVEALDYAHREGVVHGDLRPVDVLLSPEGQIKVANFAYGRVASFPDAPSVSAAVATDIGAVGALLYEMLTGAAPPAAVGGQPPSPRVHQAGAGVPPALEGIVQKALHPDSAIRYRTATTLLLDLQAVRDALRTGRSLAWSPLADRRAPRPAAADATIIAARPTEESMAEAAGIETAVRKRSGAKKNADEREDDHYRPARRREGRNPLGPILGLVFFLLVIGAVAFAWYISKFLTIPSDVQVPNLIGKTFDDAKRLASQQHFHLVEGGSDYSTKWPEDQIYQQDPVAGRTIKADRDVTVYRSLGPRLLRVPRLVGETKERALSDLTQANLPEGTVTEEYSEGVPRGVVISQKPEVPDSGPPIMVARNTAVNLTISKGKQPPDPPGNLDAEATSFDTVVLHWDKAERGDTYTVYRLENGNATTVARGLPDRTLTDKDLKPDTAYSYTVAAVNSAGASGPSAPALVTTPAKPVPPPVLPDNTRVNPPPVVPVTPPTPDQPSPTLGDATLNSPPSNAGPAPAAKMRQFTIKFRVPRHPRRQRRVQFEVQDVTGTNLVYDENHAAGDEISAPIQAFGNKITFRIFLDGKLIKAQTL